MKTSFFLLLFVINFACFAQQSNSKYWHKDSLLTWDDFKGPVDPQTSLAASTNSRITYEYHLDKTNGETIAVSTAQSYFVRDKSWGKPEYRDARLLKHEQLHFDLTEYFARQFQNIVNSRRYSDTASKEIRSIFRKVEAQQHEVQVMYDTQTKHGADQKRQKQWDEFITALLEKNPPLTDLSKIIPQ